jgi:hypothetical protein
MSRLVGVGFLVGAKDDGATDTFDDVSESTDRLADAADRAGNEAPRSIGLVQRALQGLTAINVSHIADTLDNLAERAGTGIGAQSTALESFGVQFAQTYRAATAGMGRAGEIVGEMRRQVSGVAYSLQISAEQLLQPITQLASHGRRLEDFGISVRDLGGAIQAGFIDAGNFGQVLTELTNSFGLSEERAGGLLDRITAIGEQFGVGQDAVRGFPTALEAMRPILSRFPEMGQDVEGLTESVIRLGMGIQTATGTDTRTAISQSAEAFSQLGEMRMGLQDLVTGLQTEMPNALTEMAIGLGSWDEAMQMATDSPTRFVTSLAGAMSTMDRANPLYERLRSTLNQFGTGFQVLTNGTERSMAALEAMNQPLGEVEGSFGRVSRAASGSTRTFSENLELMQDAFQTRLNSIGRRQMPDFVNRQREAYRNVGDTIAKFASDQGPLGMLTRGFLRVRTFGLVQGLLPQLGVLGEGFGEAFNQAGPFLHTMNQLGAGPIGRGITSMFSKVFGWVRTLGPAFLRVAGPIGLVAGAGYLLIRYWDRLPGLLDNLQGYLNRAGQWFSSIGERFMSWVKSIDWAKAGREAVDRLFSAISGTITALFAGDRGQGQVGSAIWSGLVNIFTGIGTMISGLASGMMERLREGFSTELGGAAGIVQRIFGVYFRGIYMHLRSVWTLLSTFGSILITPWRAWWRVVQPVAAMVLRLFSDGSDEAQGFENVLSGIVGWVERYQQNLMLGLDRFQNVAETVTVWWSNLFGDAIEPIITALQRDLPYIEEQFIKIFADAQQVFQDVFGAIGEVSSIVWDLWTETFEPIFSMLWDTVSRLFGGGRDSISGKAEYSFRHVGDDARDMWRGRIRPMLLNMVGAFAEGFRFILTNGTEMFTSLASRGGEAMLRIQTGIQRVQNVWEGLQRLMRQGWELVQSHTEGIIGNTLDYVDLTFQRMLHGWDRIISNLKIFLATSLQSMLNNITTAVTNIPAAARAAIPGLDALASGIERANHDINETVSDLRDRNTAMLREQQTEEEALRRRIRERSEEMLRDRREMRDIATETYARDRQIAAQGERQVANLRRFYTDLRRDVLEGTEDAYQRMRDLHSRLVSGEFGEERRAGERARRLGAAVSLREQLPENLRQFLSREQIRSLQQAVEARGVSEQRALSEADIANVMARITGLRGVRGRRARGEALQGIIEQIGTGRAIAAPEPAAEGGRGRRVARTAARRERPGAGVTDVRVVAQSSEVTADQQRATMEGVDEAARRQPPAPRVPAAAPQPEEW